MNTPPIADLYLKTEVSIEHEGRLIPIVDWLIAKGERVEVEG